MQLTAQKITPCLWFESQAEEAAKFYASVFENSKIGKISRYGKEGFEIHGQKAGTVMTVEFEIEGQKFVALNGGPHFKFNEAVSFQVHCETQARDRPLLEQARHGRPGGAVRLGEGQVRAVVAGRPARAAPDAEDENSEKAQRVMKSMLQMHKIDLAALQRAQAA